MIRAHLGMGKSPELWERAKPYAIEAGVQSHVDAVVEILATARRSG